MKTNNLLILLIVLLFASCANNVDNTNAQFDEQYKVSDFLTCEQLHDASGLKLYPFIPFTDEEMRLKSYEYKLERRQIPKSYMQGMTTKELFYQFVCCDLSKSMGLFNSMQQGFEALTQQLNMLPELLNRRDAGSVLLKILQEADPSRIEGLDCFWWFDCIQIIAAQPEVINRMTDEEIDCYVQQQLSCQEKIRSLSVTNENWDCPESLGTILFGLGNVMTQYKFEPFMQLLETNQGVSGLMASGMVRNEQVAALVNDCIDKFKSRAK